MDDLFKQAELVLDDFTAEGGLDPKAIKESTEQIDTDLPTLTYAFGIKDWSFVATISTSLRKGLPTTSVVAEIAFGSTSGDKNQHKVLKRCLECNIQSGLIKIYQKGEFLIAGIILYLDSFSDTKLLRSELFRLPYITERLVEDVSSGSNLHPIQSNLKIAN